MYGMKVHQAVITAGEKVSGMSIHYVNEHYDEGGIIFSRLPFPSYPEMSAEELQKAVLALEHQHFAPVVEAVMKEGVHFFVTKNLFPRPYKNKKGLPF